MLIGNRPRCERMDAVQDVQKVGLAGNNCPFFVGKDLSDDLLFRCRARLLFSAQLKKGTVPRSRMPKNRSAPPSSP